MTKVHKCDICGTVFEYKPQTIIRRYGEWSVDDDNRVRVYGDVEERKLELCRDCSEIMATFIFQKTRG